MKIRRFVANDMQEALSKIKLVLGQDAIILQTRKFREGGLLGFFGQELVEVTAAVDEKESLPKLPVSIPPAHSIVPTQVSESPREYEIKKEIAELKTLLGEMVADLDIGTANGGTYPGNFQRVYKALILSEVDQKLAQRILNDALQELPHAGWGDFDETCESVEQVIARRLRVQPIEFKKQNDKKRVVLVGPTGVGKTTTIAKLAAIFAIIEKKNIALATVDTYRVAAVDQLKTYADIMAVPLEVAYTPRELQDALTKHQEKDLVLIDTAGRSPLNEVQMTELKAFLTPCSQLEVILVLGATTKQADLLDTIRRFSQLPVKNLIFTKLDETQHYGVILNVVNRIRKKIAYITTGQNVPDDIEVPDPRKIAKLILQVK